MSSFLGTPRDILVIGVILISLSVNCQGRCLASSQCLHGASCIGEKCICPTGVQQCEIPTDKYLGIDHIWLPSVENKYLQDKGDRSTATVRLGGRLSLRCPANKATGNYTIQWTLNDTLLNPAKDPRVTINQATGQLEIYTAGQKHTRYEGAYKCRISNVFGTAYGPRAQVKFRAKGSFINTQSTVNVTVNNSLVIRCPARTYTNGVFYRWVNSTTFRDVNFPKPRVLMSIKDGTLYFTHVTDEDVLAASQGIRCGIGFVEVKFDKPVYSGLVTMNKAGENVNGAFQGTFFEKPPTTTFYLPVGAVREFYCFPSDRSPITLIWLKDSSPLISTNYMSLFEYNRTLRINSAHRSVDGMYSYRIQHADGRITEFPAMTIKVIYPTTWKHYFNYEETFTLDCMNVTQQSNYPFRWYYNAVNVSSLTNSVFRGRVFIHPNGRLTIKTAEPRDSGVYQCFLDGVASSHHYVYVLGAPLPPISLNATDCSSFFTTLSWKIKNEPNIPVSSFIIEMANTFKPNVFKQIKVVNEPNTRQIRITELRPWANITFRMKAMNSLGSSLPSRLSNPCITSPAKPASTPEGLKAVPFFKSGGMYVIWKPFPMIQWNGERCVIRVYHKHHNISTWTLSPKNTSCSSTNIYLGKLGNYLLINIKIRVQNEVGMGPNSTVVTSYSGQYPPTQAPQNFRVEGVTPYSVTLKWDGLIIQGGSVDRYMVRYISSEFLREERWPLDHPRHASREFGIKHFSFFSPLRGAYVVTETTNATVHGLLPHFHYSFAVQGVNSGGTGPSTLTQQTTLDLVDSSYIITFVVTSEAFTPEYEDKTSLKYRNLSETLTTGVKRHFRINFWFRSVALLLFRNGSVVSELQMVAATPYLQTIKRSLNTWVKEEKFYFPNFEIDSRKTSVVKEPKFTRPNISVSDSSPYPGVAIEFECVTTGGPRSPVFSWFKDGNPVVFDVRHKFSSDDRKSMLTIRKLTANDKGNYSCVVNKGNQKATSRSSVLVNVLPATTVAPATKKNGMLTDTRAFENHLIKVTISLLLACILHAFWAVFSASGLATVLQDMLQEQGLHWR